MPQTMNQMNIEELKSKTISELTNIAKTLKIQGHSGLRKQDLIFRILEAKTQIKPKNSQNNNPSFTCFIGKACKI